MTHRALNGCRRSVLLTQVDVPNASTVAVPYLRPGSTPRGSPFFCTHTYPYLQRQGAGYLLAASYSMYACMYILPLAVVSIYTRACMVSMHVGRCAGWGSAATGLKARARGRHGDAAFRDGV